jgi:hypothetical protein
MKRIIVLLGTALLLTLNLNAVAQVKKAPAKPATPAKKPAPAKEATPAAPTKQETMDWIAGKMKEHLQGNREFISYANGEFKYSKVVGVYSCTTTIYLNKITGSTPDYAGDYYVKGTRMMYTDCGEEYQARNEVGNALSIGGPNYDGYSDPFDFDADSMLLERVKKAFATLIAYNGSQKSANEKF